MTSNGYVYDKSLRALNERAATIRRLAARRAASKRRSMVVTVRPMRRVRRRVRPASAAAWEPGYCGAWVGVITDPGPLVRMPVWLQVGEK